MTGASQSHSARSWPRESPESDEQLVRRVVAGDTAAFAVIMRRHNQRLFRTTRGIIRDDAEAEDATQQAWLSAYSNLHQFRGEARLATWLIRIAINEAQSRVKRLRREHAHDHDLGSAVAVTEVQATDPESCTSSRELLSILEQLFDSLPPPYRTVLMLRDVEKLDTAETAEALGIGEENVRVRLHRGRKLLRDALHARVGLHLDEIFSFAGERCDRIVDHVLSAIGGEAAASRSDE